MPTINIPLSDLLATVERPIIYDIINRVCILTGLNTPQIRFYGEDASAAQWNSTINKDPNLQNLWPVLENLSIEVEEDYDPNRLISMAVEYPENPYIFLDNDLGIHIKPVKSPTDVIVRFKYTARDRNQVVRWRNEVRTRTAKNRDINMHDVNYSYTLPYQYLDVLEHIWTLRNNIAGYGDTFEKWFYSHMTDRITRVSNLAGKNGVLAIAEKQIGIQGLFDFEGVPEKPEKSEDNGMWSISFSYKFKYDKPINTVFTYPIMVHQQIIDKMYRFDAPAYSMQKQWAQRSLSGDDFAYFQGDNKTVQAMANRGLDIPAFDTFIPGTILPTTARIFSVLVNITPTDMRSLFNLADLGDFNLNQDILDLMRQSEYAYMPQLYGSIFSISLYAGNVIQDSSVLTIDSNLNVKATIDLNLRKVYHVRLSLVTDVTFLTIEARARLKLFPKALNKILAAISQSLPLIGGSPKNSLTPYELSTLGIPKPINPSQYGGSLVQTLFITAGTKKE